MKNLKSLTTLLAFMFAIGAASAFPFNTGVPQEKTRYEVVNRFCSGPGDLEARLCNRVCGVFCAAIGNDLRKTKECNGAIEEDFIYKH